MIADTEKRWAIYYGDKDGKFLCRKHFFERCFSSKRNDFKIQTFRTRKQAREAKKLSALGKGYEVVQVIISVTVI